MRIAWPKDLSRGGRVTITCRETGRNIIEQTSCPLNRWGEGVERAPTPSPAIPRDQWPLAARVVARLRRGKEKGLGDTLANAFDPNGGDLFKRWYRRITGADCACSNRQARLNAMYPYGGRT